jgi:hypothetical protein
MLHQQVVDRILTYAWPPWRFANGYPLAAFGSLIQKFKRHQAVIDDDVSRS